MRFVRCVLKEKKVCCVRIVTLVSETFWQDPNDVVWLARVQAEK